VDVGGVEMSLGSVAACCERVSDALAPVYEALVETLSQQPRVHVDETSWKESGQRCWLWVVVGTAATVFQIAVCCPSGDQRGATSSCSLVVN
jgi:hypothetical protein